MVSRRKNRNVQSSPALIQMSKSRGILPSSPTSARCKCSSRLPRGSRIPMARSSSRNAKDDLLWAIASKRISKDLRRTSSSTSVLYTTSSKMPSVTRWPSGVRGIQHAAMPFYVTYRDQDEQ
ncbi:hypothetical protein KCU74_g33, partial [Aureobasidium melanogenum]